MQPLCKAVPRLADATPALHRVGLDPKGSFITTGDGAIERGGAMIHLDSAATTLQKPPEVARASAWAIGHLASPGRGAPARHGGGKRPCLPREEAPHSLACPSEQVVFTSNATHGLRSGHQISGQPGDAVVVSGYDCLRSPGRSRAIQGVTVRVADSPLFDRAAALEAFRRALTPEVRAAVCTRLQCIRLVLPIGTSPPCAGRGIPLIVDASPSPPVACPSRCVSWGRLHRHARGTRACTGPRAPGLLLCGGRRSPFWRAGGECPCARRMRTCLTGWRPGLLIAGIAGCWRPALPAAEGAGRAGRAGRRS